MRPIRVPRDHEAAREQQRANIEQEKRKERINWPTQREKDRWIRLDEHLDNLLGTTLRGDVDRKIGIMSSVIYEVSKETFGVKEIKEKIQTTRHNRRQTQIQDLRSDATKKLQRGRKLL